MGCRLLANLETPTRPTPAIVRLASAAALLACAQNALAFHSGGVADCEGCHSMHNSFEGAAMDPKTSRFQTAAFLLKGTDPSSVCLHCHEAPGAPEPRSYMVSTAGADLTPGNPPRQLTPGGDFGWLRKSYTWTPSGGATPLVSPGDRHGHNVVAGEYGYQADLANPVAPGGSYPSAGLSCTSCHDPHGQYRRLAGGSFARTGAPILDSGSYPESPDPVGGQWAVGAYRLLGGVGYQPVSSSTAQAFQFPPPDAVSPSVYNRAEDVTQTRVAYGRGTSEWCANCHGAMLTAGVTEQMKGLRHPVGNDAKLSPAFQTNYMSYVKTGVLTNRDPSRGYLSLVPFEEGTASYATLKSHARTDDGFLNGPDTSSNLTCLTCHRAHASGFDSILRFRTGNTFITVADGTGNPIWPQPFVTPTEAQGRTAAETQQAYYGRPASTFAPFQTTLCNKCHVKD